MEKISLYKEQLSRMRSMNRYYHDQFLLDVRILFIFNTIFIFLSFNNKNALYLIPLISLFGSVLLSFHAYFLIFSRHYSEFIEKRINLKNWKIKIWICLGIRSLSHCSITNTRSNIWMLVANGSFISSNIRSKNWTNVYV